ncbi:phosphopantetheine-binding protein [Nocardia huaxiensis]|uniref:Isochorismatase n=1 Tax=Nocardia huaxiensis TaxID=2755382 RepID=A0A7D6ZSZ1_9NOCA|nr:phosphopantetheine-binding protein [Nocardia huaxiensis]QLY33185.1 isochorismatase [Nocardia huaxiensis]UFS93045.1 phosphopantetheine-binding protein [Nocardia huaxiensis]
MTDENTALADRVIADVATALGVDPAELTGDANLLDAGLDSVRIMSLVEKWRAAGYEHIDFPTLASDPVLSSWIEALS